MAVILAKKTQLAIEQALRKDQGRLFRELLGKNMPKAADAFDGEEHDDFRSHLGASSIGKDCPRALWYGFRWSKVHKHIGRTILLFNRGHLEEPRFVSLLEMIGCKVWQVDKKGNQYRTSWHGGHYGSAIDAVVANCPDMPGVPVMGEFKTSNTKGFKEMVKSGVRESKPVHYVQMQQYMKYYKMQWTLYMMVCKETDELYCEMVEFEEYVADQFIDRASNIIFSTHPPRPIATSPGSWNCKFCDEKEVCHNGETPARNCRTCRFSRPEPDGTWKCLNFELILTKEMQLWKKADCAAYEVIQGFGQ